jgi:hypothetical protein
MAKVKTKVGYKLFEMDFYGNLHPLKVEKVNKILTEEERLDILNKKKER